MNVRISQQAERLLPSEEHAVQTRHRRKLLIIGPLPPPFAGPELGTEVLVRSQVLNATYRVHHINTTVRSSNRDKGSVDAVMMAAYLRYLSRLLRETLFFRPELVLYCPTSATLIGWVRDGTTVLLARVLGAKLVLQFRGGHFRHFFDALGPASRRIIAWLLQRCDLVLVQADVLKSQFAGIVPDERLARLYNAVPSAFFEYFEKVGRRRARDEVVVLFVGHLTQAKGYCEVLKAIPRLVPRYTVRFQFMGVRGAVERNVFFNQATGERILPADPEQCFHEYIQRQGLANCVEFLGDGISGVQKQRVFENADIFVLPSYSEGFSRSILEAMAAGLPGVITRVGAAPEILQDAVSAYLITPGDTDQLCERLERLIRDQDLRVAMGSAAREHCRRQFQSATLAMELVALLEKL